MAAPCRAGTVPSDYESQYKRFAAQGARVIALAVRDVPPSEADTADELRGVSRDKAECGLTFAGEVGGMGRSKRGGVQAGHAATPVACMWPTCTHGRQLSAR